MLLRRIALATLGLTLLLGPAEAGRSRHHSSASRKKSSPRTKATARSKVNAGVPRPMEDRPSPSFRSTENLEGVTFFRGAMPTGVAVSRTGRVFVCFPRWGDVLDCSVAEHRKGRLVPYPDPAWNSATAGKPLSEVLLGVQSVYVDSQDHLFILDTGSVKFGPVAPGGAKLVEVDLSKDRVVKVYPFPSDIVPTTSYLNDVRINRSLGKAGMAFITDSSSYGPNGLIILDLASGRSWRRLAGHSSTRPAQGFVASVEGQPLMVRPPDGTSAPLQIGSDGLALSPDGKWVYYCPLSSRRLYRVPTNLLADPAIPEKQISDAVEDLGEKPASDGLEFDDKGRLYATAWELNAIWRLSPGGTWEVVAADPRMLWPDSLALSQDGYLYFTVNQIHRQPSFQRGRDLRQRPYALFRVKVDAGPAFLSR